MRLINVHSYEIREFHEGHIPRYAILSHTWGEPEDEVTFHDMARLRPPITTSSSEVSFEAADMDIKQKPGLEKILFACQQAIKDELEWTWVDTCCIDRTSSAELDESIMSMYRWYEQSTQCYAYLSDVPYGLVGNLLASKLRASRWFTRGWTLQELVAPRQVTFFGQAWKRLGTRSYHSTLIHDITRIPEQLLRCEPGEPFSDLRRYSAAQKMSWAAGRECKKIEDVAYCLLGLFGIYMPLQYGERSWAFVRLQEEILRKTDDHSLFAWTGKAEDGLLECQTADSILASSPLNFINSSDIVTFHQELGPPKNITTHGVKIHLPVERGIGYLVQTYPVSYGRPVLRAILNCGRLAVTTERRLNPGKLPKFCSKDKRIVLLLAETKDLYRGLQMQRCYSRLTTSKHLGVHDKVQYQDPSSYETIFLNTNGNSLRSRSADLSLHGRLSSYRRFALIYQAAQGTGKTQGCLPYRVHRAWKFRPETGRWEQRPFFPAKIENFDVPYHQRMELCGHQLQPLEFWFGFEQRGPGVYFAHIVLKTSSKTIPADNSSLSFILTELGTSRDEDHPTICDVNLRVGTCLFTAKVHCVMGDADNSVRLCVKFSVRPRNSASQHRSCDRELVPMMTTAQLYAYITSKGRKPAPAIENLSETTLKHRLSDMVDGYIEKRQRWEVKWPKIDLDELSPKVNNASDKLLQLC